MTLICGNNVSLEALDGVTDEIEAALAQGKAGLATLEAKAAEALTALESVKVPIPSVALPNLQDEINSAVTSLTANLDVAITSLPGKIAQLQETFSGLPSDELQGYIDQMTTIVQTAVTSGSLTGFDPCSLFPNKEVAADGSIVEKAKAVETPNVNATKPEDSAAKVQTVTEHKDQQPSKKPSVVSPSGKSYDEVMTEWDRVTGIIDPMIEVYWRILKDDANKAYEDYKKANSSPRSQLINLQRTTGRKALDLYQAGKMPQRVAQYYEKEQELLRTITLIDSREAIFYDTEDAYLKFLAGLKTKDDWDLIYITYATQENLEEDFNKWFQIQTQWDKYKQAVVDRAQYLNIDNNAQ
tara:strand:- start:12263 stop:13327 length:1065 start_codon:yes stop_codon:yes gene_type:complete